MYGYPFLLQSPRPLRPRFSEQGLGACLPDWRWGFLNVGGGCRVHPLLVPPWLSAMGECPRERACACVHQLRVARPHPFPPARPRPELPRPHPSLGVRPSLLPRPPSPGHRSRSPDSQTHARTRHPLTCSMLRPLCCPPLAGPKGRRGRRPLHSPWPGSCTRRPRATPGAPGLGRPSPPRRGLRPAAGSAPPRAPLSPPARVGARAPRAHTSHTQTPATSCAESHTLSHTACIPGLHTSKGSSCLSWDLYRGQKTQAPGEDPCHFPEASPVERVPPLLSRAPERSLAKGTKRLGGRADPMAQMVMGHFRD